MIDDYCYATVSATFSWLSAADVCKSLHKDADLVVVSSADKQEAVKALVANLGIRALSHFCPLGLGDVAFLYSRRWWWLEEENNMEEGVITATLS